MSIEAPIPGAGQKDAMVAVPESLLTARQEDRIRGFETLVERISVFQEKLDSGEKWEFFIKDEQGNKTGAQPITQETIEGWKETAFHMFEDFQSNPVMAQRAKAKVEQVKKEEEEKAVKKTETLLSMWEKGTEW